VCVRCPLLSPVLPSPFPRRLSLTHLEIGDNPMSAEWHAALTKGIPHVFHLCRQLNNERKLRGKPPEMQCVWRVWGRGLSVRPVHPPLPARVTCSQHY
jgi:hypothetical protein